MKTFQFKQHDTKKAVIVAIIYLLIVFLIAYFGLGGINGMADKVNSIGSAKGAGFIIGIIVMAPLFMLLQLVHPSITIDIDDQKLTVKQQGKQNMIIHFNAIDRVELNTKNLNRLDIYDKQNNLITHLQPTNKPQMLEPVIQTIVSATGFHTIRGSRKIMGKNIDTLVCSNRAA